MRPGEDCSIRHGCRLLGRSFRDSKMEKDINISILREMLPCCCNVAAAEVGSYSEKGKARIYELMPDAQTVLVLGHHLKASLEWAWFPFESERGGNTCAADLHAKAVIEEMERTLKANGRETLILPYPDACGIAFKRLAAGTRMGVLGESFLFLHREWGPWVHLRVLLTSTRVVDGRLSKADDVCLHCGKCREACAGKALGPKGHDLAACGQYQQAERDRLAIRAQYRHKCEVCARVCPVGEQPLEISIRDR